MATTRLANYVQNLPKDVLKIIGEGPKFPITVYGATEVNDGLDRINQSILIILSTPLGEVWFNPHFGSKLHEYIFSPITTALEAALRQEIIRALSQNEPRIEVLDVSFSREQIDNNVLLINIKYRVLGTNITNVYTYPFKVEPSGPYE